jgi:hypothetical protein
VLHNANPCQSPLRHFEGKLSLDEEKIDMRLVDTWCLVISIDQYYQTITFKSVSLSESDLEDVSACAEMWIWILTLQIQY